MSDARQWIRTLDRLAEGDDEIAGEAEREREAAVLKIPMALQVNCAAGEAISPSGVFSDEAIANLEGRYREHLAVNEMFSDADEILTQTEDPDDKPPPEEPAAA